MATIKLGELLIKAGVLQEQHLKAALVEQQKWGGRLGDILVRMEFLTEDILVRALARQLALPAVNVDAVQSIAAHVKAKIPVHLARSMDVVPLQLRDEGRTLVVAMSEPQNIEQIDNLRAATRCRIMPQVAGRTSIARAIGRFYHGEAELSEDMEESFKVVDAQGRTMVRSIADIQKEAKIPSSPPPSPSPSPSKAPTPAPIGRTTPVEEPAARRPASGAVSGHSALELLKAVEEVQRKEVTAIKALVELLIDKGVFSRDEYLAKVKR
jgi:hypothetical protein